MKEAIDYIISLLVCGNNELAQLVGYTSDKNLYGKYKVVIVPSCFFDDDIYGSPQSLPELPLKLLKTDTCELPVLFGEPKIENIGNTIVLYADLIASVWFLISRYEELIVKERDEHGRLSAYNSVIGKSGLLDLPVVDMYADFILSLFGVEKKERKINKIYLTHDVDRPVYYRYLRGCLGGLRRWRFKDVYKSICNIENDPAWTFPMLLQWENSVRQQLGADSVEQIYFLKANDRGGKFDLPVYDLQSKDLQLLLDLLKQNNVSFGLHSSYLSAERKDLIKIEKERLESALGNEIIYHRNHYLRSLEPQDFQSLINCGVKYDFTMSFADCAGFRLGTTKAVRWIDPTNKCLTNLYLHPLTVMDITLSDSRYMNLDSEQAFQYVAGLIKQTKCFGGEMCLLWHNSTFAEKNYHFDLYKRLLDYLAV